MYRLLFYNALGKDGANVSVEEYQTLSWWTNADKWRTTGAAFAWDFTNVWQWDNGTNLPKLKSQ